MTPQVPNLPPQEEYPEGLQEILQLPEVVELVQIVRRNIGLSLVNGEQHTTQGFQKAIDLKEAFAGKLTEFSEEDIKLKVRQLKAEHNDVIKKYGLTDEDLFGLCKKVWIYSRLTNPANELLEEALARMEKTEAAAVFSSGLAAIKAITHQFVPHAHEGENGEYIKGGKVVVIGAIYGGTYAQMQSSFTQTGRQFIHLPVSKFLQEGLPKDTSMVFCEGSQNPNLNASPLSQIAKEAKKIGALVVCDNTFTPMAVTPAELGVDLVIHSMTKYMGGESRRLGGAVMGRKELISRFSSLQNGERMTGGAVLDPDSAGEFLKSMETLPERLYFATQNAKALKEISTRYGLNARLSYDAPHFESISNKQLTALGLSNGMININFGTREAAEAFFDAMAEEKIGLGAVSLGSKMTYYSIPASTTHSEMPPDQQEKAGIYPGMVRISCGIEKDLPRKFEKILKKIGVEQNSAD